MKTAAAAGSERAPQDGPTPRRPVAWLLDRCLTVYQYTLSPLLGPRCRFYPSCSHYAQGCLSSYSLPVALKKIGGRLVRCQPFHPGGIDLP